MAMPRLVLPCLFCMSQTAEAWWLTPSPRSRCFALPSSSLSADTIYSRPSLYDLAFGYRDFEQEVLCLLHLHELSTGWNATTVVELAAGPARHAATATSHMQKTYAVDCSMEMKQYSESIHSDIDYLVQDMRHFELRTLVDTAWILLGSFQHMVTLSDAKQCLKSVYDNLQPNGTLILELPHPKEVFSLVDCTSNAWTVPLELSSSSSHGSLDVLWGNADDAFNEVTHIRNTTIGFRLQTDNHVEQWTESVPMRFYTVPELHLLAEVSGFRIVRLVGALEDTIIPIDDEDLAYRLVCVMQKI